MENKQTRNTDISKEGDIGPGLDCSVTELKYGLYLVQTIDFFYPIVDDPYIMGQIACANVLSDIYTLGITDVDSLLMILGIPCDMTSEERNIVINLMSQGFNERARVAGCKIAGGDTKENIWLTIGGVATSVIVPSSLIRPTGAEIGDALILTKPLGTNAATMIYKWINDEEKLKRLNNCISTKNIETAYHHALHSMIKLNRKAAALMQYFGAHGATDITGYGLKGHAENWLKHQKNNVDFIIDTIPLIQYVHEVEIQLNHQFKLLQGKGIETSGGLLICLPFEIAQNFITALKEEDNSDSWLIGRVVKGDREVKIVEMDRLKIINVPSPLPEGVFSQNLDSKFKDITG